MSFQTCDIKTGQQVGHHHVSWMMMILMLMDPCIVLGFNRNSQQDATFKQNLLFHRLLKAQHVSSGTPLIIRSSNCVCSLWFTYACGDRP